MQYHNKKNWGWFKLAFLLIVAIVWMILNYFIALFEEQDLKVRFGEAYINYMRNTRRFIPKRKRI